MLIFIRYLLLLLCLFAACRTAAQQANKPVVTIGMVVDGESEMLEAMRERIMKESRTLMQNSYLVRFPAAFIRYGNFRNEQITLHLESLLKEEEVDMLIVLGPSSSALAAKQAPFKKPVIATTIIDPQMQGLPMTADSTSGERNFTFINSPYSPEKDLKTFYQLYPYQKIAILISQGIQEVIPVEAFMSDIQKEIPADYQIIEVGTDFRQALSQFEGVDAVYVAPLQQLTPRAYKNLIDELNSRKLPTFSLIGLPGVRQGLFAGLAPATNRQREARRLALIIQRLLNGEQAAQISVTMNYQSSLAINMRTARQIGLFPNWDILNDAVLLYENAKPEAELITIEQAVAEGLVKNLDLQAKDFETRAGLEKIKEARAALMPQLLTQALALRLDLSFLGDAVEIGDVYVGSVVGVLSQMIYNERSIAEFAIERFRQIARSAELEENELDVVQQVSKAYLQVLRTKIIESVQRENVDLSRRNLQLAQNRYQVGYSGPADVYRFRSELATSRSRLMRAHTNRRSAEQQLNYLINKPIDATFATQDVTMESLDMLYLDPRIRPYWDDPQSFQKLEDFMILFSREKLPEINRVNALLQAQNRFQKLAGRIFYLPTVDFQAIGFYNFLQEGIEGPFVFGGNPVEIPDTSPFNYILLLRARYPLFLGMRRKAQLQRARLAMKQLNVQKTNVLLQTEQRSREHFNRLRSSYANLRYFQIALESANENFRIIRDSYSQGQESLVRLLDAQNQAIRARQASANAYYDFLANLIDVERSLGFYTFLLTSNEKEALINEIVLFMQD